MMNTTPLVLNGKTTIDNRSQPARKEGNNIARLPPYRQRSKPQTLEQSSSTLAPAQRRNSHGLASSDWDLYDLSTSSSNPARRKKDPGYSTYSSISVPSSPCSRPARPSIQGRSPTEMSLATIESLTSHKRSSSAFFSAPNSRPSPRASSMTGGSPRWYNTENELTLEEFARRLNTRGKRFEIWVGGCLQSFVMALFSPTPLVLFLFNPISLVAWTLLALWLWTRGS